MATIVRQMRINVALLNTANLVTEKCVHCVVRPEYLYNVRVNFHLLLAESSFVC